MKCPAQGITGVAQTSLWTLRHLAMLRACPQPGASSHPVVHAKEMRDTSIPSALGTLQGRAEPCGRPRTVHVVPSPGWGKQHCPKCLLPGPRAGSPSRDLAAGSTSRQQGQNKNQIFFIAQISLPCFKAEGYLGLISCNIALGEIYHHMLG